MNKVKVCLTFSGLFLYFWAVVFAICEDGFVGILLLFVEKGDPSGRPVSLRLGLGNPTVTMTMVVF